MVCIVMLLALLVYANADEHSSDTMKIKVENTLGYECQTFNNTLTMGESAFIEFYNVDPDVECFIEEKKLHWSAMGEVSRWRKYKLEKIESFMNDTWKCNILPNKTTCDVPVEIASKRSARIVYTTGSWNVKVNNKVLGTDQAHGQLYDSVTRYEFCENEVAHVDCGKQKPAKITIKVKDEPRVTCVQDNSLQSAIFMRMKAEYDGKYIECHHEDGRGLSVVRIDLKMKQKYDRSSGGVPTTSELSCPTTSFPANDNILESPPCIGHQVCSYGSPKQKLNGLQLPNVAFICKNSSEDIQIHYEYMDNVMINLTWTLPVIPNKHNEYTVYRKGTLLSTIPLYTTEASCEMTLKYPSITPSSEDDGTDIRFVMNLGEEAIDKYRVILRRAPRSTNGNAADTSDEQVDPNMLKFYIITGVLSSIIVILIVGIIWILNHIKRKEPEPMLPRNPEEYYTSNVYEDIPPFPPQWDKLSSRESMNTAYEGGEGYYTEIRTTDEQTLAKQLR